MAEGKPTQYAFKHGEVITELIKAAGIHDGNWALMIQFTLGTGSLALTPGGFVSPGALVVVQGIGIQRHEGEVPPGAVVVDAAEVNPP